MRILFCMSCLLPLSLSAQVPTLNAVGETDPIPAGLSESDDAAIWLHPSRPEESLILGTSKYEDHGQGGLGVYNLDGRQLQFFPGAKLNSVDMLGDLAVATNRSDNALDIYLVEKGRVKFISRSLLTDAQGRAFEPYGLCLQQGKKLEINVYLPTKSGILYHFVLDERYQATLKSTLDLSRLVSNEEDARMQSFVTKETMAEGEAEELEENLAERFILEGCVLDEGNQKLYVGMENLGIWSIEIQSRDNRAQLVIPVQGSWTDIGAWSKAGQPRVTDDIEGLDILQVGGRSVLVFSSQGISEFTLYDLEEMKWLGNFKIALGNDPITQTDGLAVKSAWLGRSYPEGLLVVHDDANTDQSGNVLPANYKLVSLVDLWKAVPLDSVLRPIIE